MYVISIQVRNFATTHTANMRTWTYVIAGILRIFEQVSVKQIKWPYLVLFQVRRHFMG